MKTVIYSRYILEEDVEYSKDLHNLHGNLPYLLERMKLKNAISLYVIFMIKKEYAVHIRALKQVLSNHGLIF